MSSERTTLDDDIEYDFESFRESARQRAKQRDMDVRDYLAIQIYLSSIALKDQLPVLQRTLSETEYVAWCAAVQETVEGARLLAGEVDS